MPVHVAKDETGQRYGRLLVVRRDGSKWGGAAWLCQCDCGAEVTVAGSCLRTGNTRSCGCFHRDRAREMKQLPPGVAAMNAVIAGMKNNARNRGLAWELPIAVVEHLITRPCWYCGSPPSNEGRHRASEFRYSGIDRVDNNRGYLVDNVVPCCIVCNNAKLDMGVDDFIAWIGRAHKHLEEKGH